MEQFIYEIPVPKATDHKNRGLTPIVIRVIDTIGLVTPRFLKVLVDPGSTTTMIKASTMPDKTVPVDMQEGED